MALKSNISMSDINIHMELLSSRNREEAQAGSERKKVHFEFVRMWVPSAELSENVKKELSIFCF